jgi:hypothetical protein
LFSLQITIEGKTKYLVCKRSEEGAIEHSYSQLNAGDVAIPIQKEILFKRLKMRTATVQSDSKAAISEFELSRNP